MKDFDVIKQDKRIQVHETARDGFNGWLTLQGQVFRFVCSNGGGWDHVSVSLKNRCPTWNEMCKIKDIFFDQDECCIQYHPARKNYVNMHPYCLHIWKPRKDELPIPPTIYV